MKQVSSEDVSPLIVECWHCGHREYAEIHVPPPWPPAESAEYRVVVNRKEGPAKAEQVRALRKLSGWYQAAVGQDLPVILSPPTGSYTLTPNIGGVAGKRQFRSRF